MTMSMHSFNHGLSAHPLHRLAMEAPEQLETLPAPRGFQNGAKKVHCMAEAGVGCSCNY